MMLRLIHEPDQTATEHGWIETTTPLGASAHVRTNSPAHELCDDWRRLTSGRVSLIDRTNFLHWFGPLFGKVPAGLVAELLAANSDWEHLTALLLRCPEARSHVTGLPNHVFEAVGEERALIARVLDLVRVIEAREAARLTAGEIQRDAA